MEKNLDNLLKTSMEVYDNNNIIMDKFKEKYFKYQRHYSDLEYGLFLIEFKDDKKNVVAYMKLNVLYWYNTKYKTLYWGWAVSTTSIFNEELRTLWEYGYNSIKKNDENNISSFIRLIILNSGIIINNNISLNIINALISYIIHKKIIFLDFFKGEKKDMVDNNFIYLNYNNYNSSKKNIFSFQCCSVVELKELDENNQFIDFE